MAKGEKKILVIEDEEYLLKAVEAKLKHEGFKSIGARDAESGYDELVNDNVSLIWLDLLLPKMQGLEFLQKIRKNKKFKDIPVLIVSNLDDKEKIEKAFELNVVDYKVKAHTNLEKVIEEIKGYLK